MLSKQKTSDFHWGFCYEIFEAKDFASLAMEFWLEDKRLEAWSMYSGRLWINTYSHNVGKTMS